jgi:hypothetical protein
VTDAGVAEAGVADAGEGGGGEGGGGAAGVGGSIFAIVMRNNPSVEGDNMDPCGKNTHKMQKSIDVGNFPTYGPVRPQVAALNYFLKL